MDDYQDFRPPAAPVTDAWPGASQEPAERSARFWAKCVDGLTGVGLLLGAGVVAALAIPAMVANGYLNRRIDTLVARLNVGVEKLIEMQKQYR